MGAALCSELSWGFGSCRKIRVEAKAEVAAAVPRGWFGIWGLVLLRYRFWSGQGCVLSELRAASLTSYIVSLWEALLCVST